MGPLFQIYDSSKDEFTRSCSGFAIKELMRHSPESERMESVQRQAWEKIPADSLRKIQMIQNIEKENRLGIYAYSYLFGTIWGAIRGSIEWARPGI